MTSIKKPSPATFPDAVHLNRMAKEWPNSTEAPLHLDGMAITRLRRVDEEISAIQQLRQYCEATRLESRCSTAQQQLLHETIETDLLALAIERDLITGTEPGNIKCQPEPTTEQLATLLYRRFELHQTITQQNDWLDSHGNAIPTSVLAQWLAYACTKVQPLAEILKDLLLKQSVLHVEEIPVSMFKASHRRTQRSHLWMYCTNYLSAQKLCVFDFGYSKAGQHIDDFLRLSNKTMWRGVLVCDGSTCYKPVLQQYVSEADTMTNVERKFQFLWDSTRSIIADETLRLLRRLKSLDWDLRFQPAEKRVHFRNMQAQPILNFMHACLQARRTQVPHISVAAQAIDYTLSRWDKLTRYINEESLVFSNSFFEDAVYPIAREDSINWVFATSIRGGDRAAAMMSLIATAKLNQQSPSAFLVKALEINIDSLEAEQIFVDLLK